MPHRWKIVLSGLSLSLLAFACKTKPPAVEEPLIVTEVHMVRPEPDPAPAAAGASTVPVVAPSVDSLQEQAEFCRQVERQALDTNASLPKRLDQDTSATRVVAYGCDVVLEYAMHDLAVGDVAVDGVRAMRREVLQKLCSDRGARGVMDHGGSFTNVYRDAKLALIDQFTITTEDCSEAPVARDVPAHVDL
ncbi:MAG TPA: hypothetical protein VFS67_00870 [Polyangiaceae bacterium]|jgi:hypothetical protein|nr:hypothetical protein [Polyangiaceae bacterium]